jgi:hypothetical protein
MKNKVEEQNSILKRANDLEKPNVDKTVLNA